MAEEFRTVRMVEGSSAGTYDEVVSLLKRTGIAGGCGFVRGTAVKDEGRRIVMECKGAPHDGVGASVVLSFGDDGRLRKVREHSSFAVAADSISGVFDVGGSGLFLVSFSLEGKEVAHVLALSRALLAERCRLREPDRLLVHLLHLGIHPTVSKGNGRLTIGFGREGGRLVYVKDGEEYRLASFQSGGKTVRVDAVDIGRSTRTMDGITLSLVDGAGFECARIVGTRR